MPTAPPVTAHIIVVADRICLQEPTASGIVESCLIMVKRKLVDPRLPRILKTPRIVHARNAVFAYRLMLFAVPDASAMEMIDP